MAGELSDEALVGRSLAGDDDAYAELASRHRGRIAAMAWRFAGNESESQDLLQDIFLRAWRKLHQYRNEVPFEHWLSKLAIRQCYDHLRRKRRNREIALDAGQWEFIRAPRASEIDTREAGEFLQMGMSRLSADERLVLTLLELEEKSVHEISGLTGWSESKVKVRAFRARAKLKTLLEKIHGDRLR